MKRGGYLKRTPLKRGKAPVRKTRVKAVNKERARKARERDFGDHAKRVKWFWCCVCEPDRFKSQLAGHATRLNTTPNDVHHEPPRRLGGTQKDLVPLCRLCHSYRHTVGKRRFEEEFGIDLEALASQLWADRDIE